MTTAFVLGGGGLWGAVEVGMLQALSEANIKPDLIVGTSIGAFNGSVIADAGAADPVDRLTDLWTEIAGGNIFKTGLAVRVRNLAAFRPAIHTTERLQGLLEDIHGTRLIEELAVPFPMCRLFDRTGGRALVHRRTPRPGIAGQLGASGFVATG